ncbi:putative O-methyltransferase [Stemphylium lycopersici]|nr:putative O-methyltransferase [Stemphylium lycopersici]
MSSSQSRIAEIAATIAQHTQRVDEYLSKNSLPYPSFDASGPVDLGLPSELEESRNIVLRATQELNDLLHSPKELIFNHHHNAMLYMHFISRFDIAHKVPVDGEITFKDLATKLGMDSAAVTNVLRLGIAFRVFKEPRPGVIAHSAASRQLAENALIADWVAVTSGELWPAAQNVVDALAKWPKAAEPNQTGFSLANQTDLAFYDVLTKEPERARRFGGAMSFFSTGEGYSLRHLTDGYPWATVSFGTVVDLGGSHGDAAFALARKFPDLHLVVQDLPEVIANANVKAGLDVKFLAHNFFEEQPVKGADVYYYRWTLHNWPDQYCIKALRALVPALKPGSRILIIDAVMPPPGTLPNDLDRKLRAVDSTMLEIGNARERDLAEWKGLFEEADTKFKFLELHQPPGSSLAIVEVVWET